MREAEMFCFKAADPVLAPSRFIVGELRRDFECDDVAISVVRNPYRPLPAQAKPDAASKAVAGAVAKPKTASMTTPYYVFGSRLAAWKGVLDVARAFDLYWAAGGSAALRLFGSDSTGPGNAASMAEFIRARYH